MHHEDKHMLTSPQVEQGRADSRLRIKPIEAAWLVNKQAFDLRLTRFRRETAEIDFLKPQRPALVHDGDGLFVYDLYCGPQYLMSGHDHVQCTFYRIYVEFPLQPHGFSLIVNRQPRI